MNDVYILQSLSHPGQFYTGLCRDVSARLMAHNSGQSPHTSKYRPCLRWRSAVRDATGRILPDSQPRVGLEPVQRLKAREKAAGSEKPSRQAASFTAIPSSRR